jgi:hypothetical protein
MEPEADKLKREIARYRVLLNNAIDSHVVAVLRDMIAEAEARLLEIDKAMSEPSKSRAGPCQSAREDVEQPEDGRAADDEKDRRHHEEHHWNGQQHRQLVRLLFQLKQ